MTLDLGRIVSRAFSITWRRKWLWLLGVFSGGFVGTGFNYSLGRPGPPPTSLGAIEAQARAALHQWLGLALAVGSALVVIWLVALAFNCVAAPAATWAAVHLDDGEAVTLGDAWREGRRRFGAYLRLTLVQVGIGLLLGAWPALLFGTALVRFANGERFVDLLGLVITGVLLAVLLGFVGLVVNVALVWAGRVLVLLDLGALESIREGWRLLLRDFLDTIVFAIVMGLVAAGVAIVVGAAVLFVSIPGIVVVVLSFSSFSAATIAGIAWVIVFGGAAGLLGGAYIGSLVQVGYALACRDLLRGKGPSPVVGAVAPAPTA